MSLKYTQTKQGQNLSTLAVPTAPKAKDTTVAPEKKYIPKGWQETLLPSLVSAGLQGMQRVKEDNKRQALDYVNNSYIAGLSEDTTADMTLRSVSTAAKQGTIEDTKILNQAEQSASKTGRLDAWGKRYSNTVKDLVEKFNLSDKDRDELIAATNNKFNTKLLGLQKEAYEENKTKGLQELSSKNFKDVMTDIVSNSYDPSKVDPAIVNGLKGWKQTHEEIRKVANDNVVKALPYIAHNKASLEKLRDTYKNFIGAENSKGAKSKLTESDLKTYNVIQKAYDAEVKRERADANRTIALDTKARDERITTTFKTASEMPLNDVNTNIDPGLITKASYEGDVDILVNSFKHTQLATDLLVKYKGDEDRVNVELRKYIETSYFPKVVLDKYRELNHKHMPLELIPDKFKPYLKQVLAEETTQDLSKVLSNNPDDVNVGFTNINHNFKTNPKEVAATVKPYIQDFYNTLIKPDLPDETRAELQSRLKNFVGGLDSKLVDASVDKDLHLKLEILQDFNHKDAMIAIGKINDGVTVKKRLVELNLDKLQKRWFNSLPSNDRASIIEDYAKKILVYEHYDFDKFKEQYEHRVYKGVTLDKEVATEFNSDKDRDALMYFLKSNHKDDGTYYEEEIPEGATIKKVGGSYTVFYNDSVYKSVSEAKVLDFKKKDAARREAKELYDKDHHEAWYEWMFKSYKGLGLGGTGESDPFDRKHYYNK